MSRVEPGPPPTILLCVPYMAAALLTPSIILLCVAPDLEVALCYAAVVVILLGAGWALLGLVFAERVPANA